MPLLYTLFIYGNSEDIKYELLFIINGNDHFDDNKLIIPRYAAIDNNENIYILDRGGIKVYVYNIEGKLINSFGGKGEGPGEFSNAVSGIFYLPYSDRIGIVDNRHRRVTLFKTNGEYDSSFFGQDFIDKIAEMGDGRIITTNFIMRENHSPIHIYSDQGEYLMSLGKIAEPREDMFTEFSRDYYIFAYDDKTRLKLGDTGKIYYAQRSPYHFVEYDLGGNINTTFYADTPFPMVSGAIKETVAGGVQFDYRPSGAIMEIGMFQDYLGAVVTGPDQERFVDLFSPGGEFVNRVQFPEEPALVSFVINRKDILVIISASPDIYPAIYVYRINYQ